MTMNANKSVLVGDDKVEEFYWCGNLVTYVNNKLVTTDFDTTVSKLTQEYDEHARTQHEIKMTDDLHYREYYRKEQKRLEREEHGIDE